MQKIINLYCDESCHLKNNGKHVSMLGYIGVSHHDIKKHKLEIKKIRDEHKMFTEIKWNKVSKSKFSFYEALIDYFINSEMVFRGLIIPTGYSGKTHVDEEEYYKMYLKLLSHELNMNFTYNIYIDIKDTHSHQRVKDLKERLEKNFPIKHNNVQTIKSYESVFIQFTDLILGAFSYELNVEDKVDIKKKLVEKLISKIPDYRKVSAADTDLFLIDIHKY